MMVSEGGLMTEPASLLLDFVNTRDVQPDIDELETPGSLATWLAEHHLVPVGTRTAEPAELTLAITLRDGLRAAFLSHHGPDQEALPAELDDALSELPVRVSLAADGPALRPAGDGIVGGLSGLAAAIMETVADGTWPRLKLCLEDTCRWAFLDVSKNRSRSWCSMRVCGNRTKTRAYRARRRADDTHDTDQ
jgi:predicted RNA-binding Zn ribbon-like protein